MDFIDNEVDVSGDDDDILVPSSQQISSSSSARPAKRRRLQKFSSSSENEDVASVLDEYDLPSNDAEEDDGFGNSRSKYDAVMHVPAYADAASNEFVSQVEQQWSSPTAIRGPRWQKKNSAPSLSPVPFRTTGSKQNRLPAASTFGAAQHTNPAVPIVVDEFDDDELEALMAGGSDQMLTEPQIQPKRATQQAKNMRQTTLFGMSTTQRDVPATQSRTHNWPMTSRNELPTHHDINKAAMQTWVYPLNVGTIRDYQFNIVHRALFHNILVALPTGLGKTFIAATVMLNYYNWTKNSQIVFVAPTKPLVTQQVSACFHIAGIPRSQTTLLTGEIQPAIRAEEWQEKRVFFMTPQTLINDLKTGMADPKKIVLVVVDEAHKATGNYAYVEVVKFLRRFNSSFRVLALTATPGSTVEAVQKVVDGLGIARVEIRTEESIDIRSYIHTRNENVEIFDNSEEIEMCLDLFATAVRPVLTKVSSLNAYFSNDPKTMTLYGLMKGREQWSKSEAGRRADWGLKGMVQSCFKPLMSLAHNLELLKFHGIGPFCHKMKVFDEEAPRLGKYAKQIVESESYKTLMNRLRAWVNDENFVGHPKLTYLNEVVLNHFMDAGDGLGAAAGRPPSDTRIMVFAHYRDSAEEIVRVLNRHQPMIRAHVFVGQSGTKGSEGMDQKTQIDIIKKFKAGTYNTLVATSIGEEGLDIGEVDLIVCYDCSKSPIRMLQRMGRTGRKRAGNIVLLLMRGKEERDYHSAKDNYLKMQEIIASGKEFQFHEDVSPRIVPKEIQPAVDKRFVDIPFENTQAESPEPRRKKARKTKRPPKKFHMPDNVETGFQFLGHVKKQKDQVTSRTPVRRIADQQEARLPELQNVLLSEKDEQYLEHHYAQVAGSETQFVQAVKLDTFPEAIHHTSRTHLVKHSNATKRLVQASKAMRNSDRQWERPERPSINGKTASAAHAAACDAVTNGRPSRPDSLMISSDREDNSGSESASEDGAPIVRSRTKPSTGLHSSLAFSESNHTTSNALVDRPFYVSQQSVLADDSEIDDLPSMNELVPNSGSRRGRTSLQTVKGGIGASNSRTKRLRKILSDDSDE